MEMFYRDSRGSMIASVLWIVAVIFVAAMIIFPMLTRPIGDRCSSCQSNLNQIGKAIRTYMTDWNDKYPTNRLKTGNLHYDVPLSENIMVDNQPAKFQHGVNWVEALYPYIERVGAPGDNQSVWKCPSAGMLTHPVGSQTASCSYALNMNLLEQNGHALRASGNTMLIREMDRLFGSVCRPINISKDSKTRPKGAFLTETEPELPRGTRCKAKLHGPGSMILFTDGHVKSISCAAMPIDDKLVWDDATKQWWNSGDMQRKMITITP